MAKSAKTDKLNGLDSNPSGRLGMDQLHTMGAQGYWRFGWRDSLKLRIKLTEFDVLHYN